MAKGVIINGNFECEGLPTLKELERTYVIQILNEVKGDIGTAAEILGITKTGLYSKIRLQKIDYQYKFPMKTAKYRNETAAQESSESGRYATTERIDGGGVQEEQGSEKSL